MLQGFQDPSADGAVFGFKVFKVHVQVLKHIVDVHVPRYLKEVVGLLHKVVFHLVAFVPDIAYQLLQDVLHRHNAHGAAVVVSDHRQMGFGTLQLVEEEGYLHGLVDKGTFVEQGAQLRLLPRRQCQQIFPDIQYSDDAVNTLFIHRYPGVMPFADRFINLFGGVRYVDGGQINPWGQNFLGRNFIKVQGALHQVAFLFFQDTFAFNGFDNVLQLVFCDIRLGLAGVLTEGQLFNLKENPYNRF